MGVGLALGSTGMNMNPESARVGLEPVSMGASLLSEASVVDWEEGYKGYKA